MSPEELLQEAQQKGVSSLAITDINNTSGVLDFFRLAPKYGIKPVAGIEFKNSTEKKFTAIAKNAEGFYELNIFLSQHLHSEEPFPAQAPPFENAFVIYPFGENIFRLKENEFVGIKPAELFKLNFSRWKHNPQKLVALAPVTFRNRIDFNTHRLLRAIDKNILLSKLDPAEQACPDEVMFTPQELKRMYSDYPLLPDNAQKLLEPCMIDFEFGKNKNKKTFTSGARLDYHKLMQLSYEGLAQRYDNPDEHIIDRFEKEIQMICELGYSAYFLISWDIVRYARSKNYFYTGRGSGANSMVAYLLRITDVDPIDLDLYFERFINAQRTSPPDFDMDFSSDERDDVIAYIFRKHTPAHTALLAAYNTFQWDAAVRELGKVFGLPKAEIDSFSDKGNVHNDHISKLILRYGQRIINLPHHLSIHAGGVLISEKPVHHYSATTLPPKNFPLVQFSMLEAEDVGLYKFDILAQRGLGKIRDAVNLISKNRNVEVDIHDIRKFKEDEAVKENLRTANLIGCFYVESPAMRMLLKKLKASTYLDLVAASSIIRPGVAQSGMMREYILRFHDESRRQYIHPMMQELMSETFGVMVYQEDVIKVAHYFAGLSLTEADMLRRGMSGKYRGREEFKKVEKNFFDNCRAKGRDEAVTAEVWRQIESFAGYAFSKGHSASYAVESYQCMYLKTHYPLEFMTAVINNGGGFYATEYYAHEARLCGGNIHAPDINRSLYETTIYGNDIYLGFGFIHELEHKTATSVLDERQQGGYFLSLEDFMKRVEISVEQLRLLIRINAFRFTGRTKQQLLWDIHAIVGSEKKTNTTQELFEAQRKTFLLPKLQHSKTDDAWDEMELLGFPLCSPFDLVAHAPLQQRSGEILVATAVELAKYAKKIVSVTGYFVTRKHTRTKKGEVMAFGTFLDKNGQWIDTVHFPDIIKQFPFRGRGCYFITGKVTEEFGFYTIDVMRMERLEYRQRYEETTCDVV
jgi:DNA polymerase-3 subunit alpha